MNQGWTFTDRIRVTWQGWRVLDYYATRYPHSSMAEWQARIDAGQITVDGVTARADAMLLDGQTLRYTRPPWQEPHAPRELPVVWEDDALMVVNKPSGLPVLPGAGYLQNTVWGRMQAMGHTQAQPVHRLGRGTTGLLLLGKTSAARAALSAQLRQPGKQGAMHKTYVCWLPPSPALPNHMRIAQPIGQVPHPHLGGIFAAKADGAKSFSIARRLVCYDTAELWAVRIATGRPHQIRIHMASVGSPLLDDPLYLPGGHARDEAVPGDMGYYLHAAALHFRHPSTQRWVHLRAPPPPAFCAVVKNLDVSAQNALLGRGALGP